MASVVLNQPVGRDQLYASGALIGVDGILCNGAVVGNTVVAKDTLQVQATLVSAGTQPTAYNWDNTGFSGGGLVPNHLQLFGYFDPAVTPQTIQEFVDAYPAAIGGTAPANTTISVFRTTNSLPLNYSAPFVGTTTGTGAALVVACAGIAAGAQIRFSLIGGSIAAFAAGIAAPSAVTVQGNVSFTYTGTTGAIYRYEVLQA